MADRCFLWKPGSYEVRWLTKDGRVPLGPYTVVVEKPQGVDKEVYEKLLIPRITGPLLGQDLLLGVYGDFSRFKDRPPVRCTILAKYPTSTYAGYILARNTVGFSNQPFSWLDDPDGSILDYYRAPDGRIGVTQAHIEQEKAAMAAFAKSAGPFLEAHPDFVQSPLIRRMYIMCLGLTGQMAEATEQLRTLAQGTGNESDEAKAYLEKQARGAPNP
ncbi:MAG: hypothetical protein WBS54_02525 [Acidobacteriota bacterium]